MPSLLTRLKNEETRHEAFEELVRTYTPQLYSQIRRMVLYHDDADDVLQNTFMKAWLAMDNFRGDAQLSTWLYRIAMNESLTFLQKQRESLSLDAEECHVAERLEADKYFDGDEAETQLQAAISKLPDKQRIVFNLRYFEDLSYEEISHILDTSVGALKASYHFATQKLKAFLENHEI